MHLPKAGKPVGGYSQLGIPAFFAAGGDLDHITLGRGGEKVGVRGRGLGEAPKCHLWAYFDVRRNPPSYSKGFHCIMQCNAVGWCSVASLGKIPLSGWVEIFRCTLTGQLGVECR